MKQLKEKYKRTVKYWRVTYKQSSGRDRLLLGVFALTALIYIWWGILAL